MQTVINIDPICGMVVKINGKAISFTYAGWTYLFCCEECLERFRKSPEACVTYLAHSRSACMGHLCRHLRASSQLRLRVGESQL